MLEKGAYAVVLLFVLANDGVLISAGNCPGRGGARFGARTTRHSICYRRFFFLLF